MDDEVTIFERFFKAEILGIAAVVTCVVDREFNSIAPPKAVLPYGLFKVIPLDDNTGQARTSIQSRFLIDQKFISAFPLPATIAPAVAAIKEHFRSAQTFNFEGYRISVWHVRPISFIESGATADERLLNRGGTYQATMSAI